MPTPTVIPLVLDEHGTPQPEDAGWGWCRAEFRLDDPTTPASVSARWSAYPYGPTASWRAVGSTGVTVEEISTSGVGDNHHVIRVCLKAPNAPNQAHRWLQCRVDDGEWSESGKTAASGLAYSGASASELASQMTGSQLRNLVADLATMTMLDSPSADRLPISSTQRAEALRKVPGARSPAEKLLHHLLVAADASLFAALAASPPPVSTRRGCTALSPTRRHSEPPG